MLVIHHCKDVMECIRFEEIFKDLIRKPEGRRERNHQGTDERIILRKLGEHVSWIHLAQDRDHWRALINMLMNL
jgi:hypothetical protein